MKKPMKKIGTVTLSETRTFTQYGEVAAWSNKIQCEPQAVDLFSDGYCIRYSFAGVVTESDTPTLLAGLRANTGKSGLSHPMTPAIYSESPYFFQLPYMMASPKDAAITFAVSDVATILKLAEDINAANLVVSGMVAL
jgi:hypothetical protein